MRCIILGDLDAKEDGKEESGCGIGPFGLDDRNDRVYMFPPFYKN